MAYNNLTSRTDASALIPEEVYRDMMGKATEESAVLNLFRSIPVARAQTRIPVLSALPTAYFVTGDTGLKQTTEVNWTNKFLNVEEIATIMPVPDNVVADVEQDIWDTAMPLLVEAFYRTLDAAVFFGTNAPSSWPTNLAAAATAAGNAVTASSVATAGAFFGDLDNAYEKVEADGYNVTGFVGATSVKSRLRKSRDSQGRKLDESRVGGSLTSIDGLPIIYPMRGMFGTGSGSPTLFAGDFSQFVVGVRQDITMKVLDQAVIQDNTGAIVYNLAQQDMTAIRLTFRVGWQVANTINNEQPTEANRYPVARIDLP
ncbi:phage major capsid protein [Streptomyces sp. NPDC004436]